MCIWQPQKTNIKLRWTKDDVNFVTLWYYKSSCTAAKILISKAARHHMNAPTWKTWITYISKFLMRLIIDLSARLKLLGLHVVLLTVSI